MIKEKIAQYREYKKLKQQVQIKFTEMQNWYQRVDMLRDKISRVYHTPKPHVAPQKWGTREYPCEVVYQVVSDSDIAQEAIPTIYHCPHFKFNEPCVICCGERAVNNKYLEDRASYYAAKKEYNKALDDMKVARARFFGCTK